MDENNALVSKPQQWWAVTREFWTDTRSEMKKVSWPGRTEVMNTTLVVVVTSIIFAVYLWGCDVIFYKAIGLLFSKFGASVSS